MNEESWSAAERDIAEGRRVAEGETSRSEQRSPGEDASQMEETWQRIGESPRAEESQGLRGAEGSTG